MVRYTYHPTKSDGTWDMRYNSTYGDTNSKVVIFCEAGSYAQTYARENYYTARLASEYSEE